MTTRITIADVQRVVAKRYGLSRADLLCPSHARRFAWPRQMAMALAREFTGRSLKDLSYHFGGRDHSTVIHAIRAVKEREQARLVYMAEMQALRAQLGVVPRV